MGISCSYVSRVRSSVNMDSVAIPRKEASASVIRNKAVNKINFKNKNTDYDKNTKTTTATRLISRKICLALDTRRC